jgi:hypothetical protein
MGQRTKEENLRKKTLMLEQDMGLDGHNLLTKILHRRPAHTLH